MLYVHAEASMIDCICVDIRKSRVMRRGSSLIVINRREAGQVLLKQCGYHKFVVSNTN